MSICINSIKTTLAIYSSMAPSEGPHTVNFKFNNEPNSTNLPFFSYGLKFTGRNCDFRGDYGTWLRETYRPLARYQALNGRAWLKKHGAFAPFSSIRVDTYLFPSNPESMSVVIEPKYSTKVDFPAARVSLPKLSSTDQLTLSVVFRKNDNNQELMFVNVFDCDLASYSEAKNNHFLTIDNLLDPTQNNEP